MRKSHIDVAYEGDQIRQWLNELQKSIEKMLVREEGRKESFTVFWTELQEIRQMASAVRQAAEALVCFRYFATHLEQRMLNGNGKTKHITPVVPNSESSDLEESDIELRG